MKRSSGILMPIFSLPSPYGIGTLGKAAYDFADFLAEAGQHYWQMLPLGPTSYGDSPYQSFSTFAGNPYFIDPDLLVEDGLLTKQEVKAYRWGSDPRHVDYGAVYNSRLKLLSKAKKRGWERDREEVTALQDAQNERESQVEMLRAELQTLQGALTQARADRTQLMDEISALRRAGGEGLDHAALRQEIVSLADRLMSAAPKREAAE